MPDADRIYHDQPHTLDDRVKIEDDAPLAQGHDDERADTVAEALDEHKAAVEAERDQPDVGARKPGDHAGSEDSDDSDDQGAADGTVDDVLDRVGDDPEKARQALDAENAKPSPRTTLVTRLEEIAG